ncbi:methyltransferase [Galdieria sulphuraria]|uniref:Methyltransferase n=1 Tax=Galdieria sulphuraria TaxID=130081 RepID=M2W2Q4_GALSU|nr:methyltransferase [Galdieria sulphuraria]EME29976.1 methyltransferase [Galdieria sulphuraria]|eukprot:XP_005706496.1 methyltransferase [Galdieria sulphuraria]
MTMFRWLTAVTFNRSRISIRILPKRQIHEVFDRKLKRLQRERAARNFDEGCYFLHKEVANRLCERLNDIPRALETALDVGCGYGHVRQALSDFPGIKRIVETDISESCTIGIVSVEEFLPFQQHSFDMAISCLSMHWINDLPGFLAQLNRVLKPDGLFLGAMFGGDSLHELRVCLQLAEEQVHGGLSPRVSPFVQTSDVGSVLSRGGFKLTTIDTDRLTVKFEDMFQLLRFLQATGENNANCLRGGYFGKEAFQLASELYRQQYSDDEGYIFASIHVVYMIGWSPHPDQQQPKKRGSAQFSLKDLGNAVETSKPDMSS